MTYLGISQFKCFIHQFINLASEIHQSFRFDSFNVQHVFKFVHRHGGQGYECGG